MSSAAFSKPRHILPPPTDDQVAAYDRAFSAVLEQSGGKGFSPTAIYTALTAIRDGEVRITPQRVIGVPEQAAACISDSVYGRIARERVRIWNRASGANGFMIDINEVTAQLTALAAGKLEVVTAAKI